VLLKAIQQQQAVIEQLQQMEELSAALVTK
jgi:hypothetical protein